MAIRYFLMVVWLLSAYSGFGQHKQAKRSINKSHTAENNCKTKNDDRDIDNNFCNVLMQIMADGLYSNFENIRGVKRDSTSLRVSYTALKGIPGTITSGIINASGWSYEGIIYRDSSKKDLVQVYSDYSRLLKDCLVHSGYILTNKINNEDSLKNYPDISYKYATGGAVKIELKVDYSDINRIYTVTLFVIK